jgi:hypothetical protein
MVLLLLVVGTTGLEHLTRVSLGVVRQAHMRLTRIFRSRSITAGE